MNIYFAHGKESGPWGIKIEALAQVARLKRFSVESPDYSKQHDPDARVEQLLNLKPPASDLTILVGSSMGGYVATVASQMINPVGLFLMAPAFYMSGYNVQNPVPHAKKTVIVHGLNDVVVPVANSIRYAQEHNMELHLLDGDHSLTDQLPKIEVIFDWFLEDVIKLCRVPKVVTWEEIDEKAYHGSNWIMDVWGKFVLSGYANYNNDVDRTQVLLNLLALTDFYNSFLSEFSRDPHTCLLEESAAAAGLSLDILNSLLNEYVAKNGKVKDSEPSIHDVLQEIAQTQIYPRILECFGDISALAESIYGVSYPTYYEEEDDDYLLEPDEYVPIDGYIIDPEDENTDGNILDAEAAKMDAINAITIWLEQRGCLAGKRLFH